MESLIQHDEEEIEDEVNALKVNDDEAFEFMDIFDKCKEHIAQGYEIQFKTHGVVEKDEMIKLQNEKIEHIKIYIQDENSI